VLDRRPLGRALPLLPHRSGTRAAVTCRYRCADQCAHPAPNTGDDPAFGDVVAGAMSRRGFLDFEHQTAAVQEQQVGYSCDHVTILPPAGRHRGGARALLVVNHEYTDPELMFRDHDPEGTSERGFVRQHLTVPRGAEALRSGPVARR